VIENVWGSKPVYELFIEICSGTESIKELSSKTGKKPSWISNHAIRLRDEGFVKIVKKATYDGMVGKNVGDGRVKKIIPNWEGIAKRFNQLVVSQKRKGFSIQGFDSNFMQKTFSHLIEFMVKEKRMMERETIAGWFDAILLYYFAHKKRIEIDNSLSVKIIIDKEKGNDAEIEYSFFYFDSFFKNIPKPIFSLRPKRAKKRKRKTKS